jgi:hypothetical protein
MLYFKIIFTMQCNNSYSFDTKISQNICIAQVQWFEYTVWNGT